VNGVLRQIARRGRALLPPDPAGDDPAGLALRTSHPAWWVRRLLRRCDAESARALLDADNRPVRPVLRPNLRVTGADELADELRSAGLRVERCRYAPDALRVTSGSLRRCAALRENRAWVQDEASQLVPALFGEPRGPRMADLCAAPGGKSLQLAERLPAGGFLVAVDRHRGRLGRMAANVRRVGARDIGIVQADVTAPRPALRGPFDGILVDAPCSGTGTFRRHPEIRWRLREEDLKLLAARQRRILDRAASLLAPGGRLVYAVCSMEPEEGEQVVHGLLASRPELAIADARVSLPGAARRLVDEAGFLRTSPADGGLDGFFAAALDRREDAVAGGSGR
jgi:16S rRNA (cytosine967-C5)-methyltransferase